MERRTSPKGQSRSGWLPPGDVRRWLLLVAVLAVVAASTAVAVEREPDVQIDVADEPVASETVAFAADTDPPGFGERFTWRIDGERMADTERFRHVFGESGEYEVSVVVANADRTVTANATVDVDDGSDDTTSASRESGVRTAFRDTDTNANASPSPRAQTTPSSTTVGEVVRFTPSSAAEEAAQHEWTIGETTMARNYTFRHMFHRPGRYQVTLTRTVADGSTTTERYEVTVATRPDEPDRTVQISPETPAVGDDVAIGADPEVAARASDLTWLIEGERVASTPRFRHSFDGPGAFNLTLVASTRDGTERHRRTVPIENGSTAADD